MFITFLKTKKCGLSQIVTLSIINNNVIKSIYDLVKICDNIIFPRIVIIRNQSSEKTTFEINNVFPKNEEFLIQRPVHLYFKKNINCFTNLFKR